MLKAALTRGLKFVGDISKIGCTVNPRDPCATNKYVNNKQYNLTWNADDVKASHIDEKISFARWCDQLHDHEKLSHTKVARGEKCDYLGVTLDYSQNKELLVDVTDHVDQSKEYFPCPLKKETKPWSDKILLVDSNSKRSDDERSKVFHAFTMTCVFSCKRRRPHVEPGTGFLAARHFC